MTLIQSGTYRDEIEDSGNVLDTSEFGVQDSGQIKITKYDGNSETTLVITTDYTVSGDLGTVTLNSALTSGQKAVATITVADTQLEEWTVNSSVNEGPINNSLQKLTLIAKEKSEELDRVIVQPISLISNPGQVFASFTNKAGFYSKVNSGEDFVDFTHLGGATFWQNFTFPLGDGDENRVLYTDGSDKLDWSPLSRLGKYKVIAKVIYHGQDTITVDTSYNISSIAILNASPEAVDIVFTNPVSNTNYMVFGFVLYLNSSTRGTISGASMFLTDEKTKAGCRVRFTQVGAIQSHATINTGKSNLIFIQ